VQFLDQEIQALADFAALLEQALDLVQVGIEAGDLLGHVDADGEGGGLGQGAVTGGLGQGGAIGQGHGLLPALHEALALLLHQQGHHGHGLLGQGAQLLQAVQQHGGQALAFALAGRHQRRQGLFGQDGHGLAPVLVARMRVGAQAQRVGHAQRRGVGQPGLDRVLQGIEALQQPGGRVLQGVAVFVLQRGAHLHLAALQARGEQGAQGGLHGTQFVGQAKRQVQEAAVDRTDLQPQAARLGGAAFGFSAGGGRAVLRAGIAGHAVNWHWTF